MRILHLANTDFEFELAGLTPLSIEEGWNQHSLCLQLQFLPLLYANKEDVIAVTTLPEPAFTDHLLSLNLWKQASDLPAFTCLSDPSPLLGFSCQSWGFSKRIQQWAKLRSFPYSMPDWSVVKTINSKLFSFEQAPSMKESQLVWNKKELDQWLAGGKGKKVIKTCFGLSGKGNRLIEEETDLIPIYSFCEKEWGQGRPIIAEPWLNRVLDFSTQWNLRQKEGVQFIGATKFEVNDKGAYQGTSAGPETLLFQHDSFFLEEHKKIVYPLLEKILSLGFFGPLGVDAFLYLDDQKKIALCPIVEINGRQTMSLATFYFQKRWFPNQIVRLFFDSPNSFSPFLLPTHIQGLKGEVAFKKSLVFQV